MVSYYSGTPTVLQGTAPYQLPPNTLGHLEYQCVGDAPCQRGPEGASMTLCNGMRATVVRMSNRVLEVRVMGG